MKHIWSVICQNSQIDIDTNNLTLSSVLAKIFVAIDERDLKSKEGVTNILLNYEVASLWIKEEVSKKVEAEIVLEIFDPQRKLLKSFTQMAEMPNTMRRLRTRFRIQGIGLTTSGVYEFVIKIKEKGEDKYKNVAEVPLEVQIDKASKNPDKKI